MTFRNALNNKDFVTMAELALTPDSNRDTILSDAAAMADLADGYLLTDNQYGQPHMSPLAAASLLLADGFSPVVQLSCRNRNRIALLGELLGARALGVDSLVLVRGTKVPEGYKPRPRAVMDVDAKELIAIARKVNEDEKLGASHTFLLGASATVHDPTPEWQPEELTAKADAGAQMIVTQLCLDLPLLRRYMAFLVERQLVRRMSVIVSLAVPVTAEQAAWLRDNRRSAIVPADVMNDLAAADSPSQAAIDWCARALEEIRDIPGITGVNFVATGNLESVARVIEKAAA